MNHRWENKVFGADELSTFSDLFFGCVVEIASSETSATPEHEVNAVSRRGI